MNSSELLTSEFPAYAKLYIDYTKDHDLMDFLSKGQEEVLRFMQGIPNEKLEYRYEVGKWTPKEIFLHIIDTERVFAYRALQFARSTNAILTGFDEGEFALNSNANDRTIESLLVEFTAVRESTLSLFNSFGADVLKREGIANGKPLSVRAAGFIIAGHAKHHCNIVAERYL